jgi:hypothetical protein
MIGSVNNWEELWYDFCHSFSPFGRSELLLCEFREFGQLEGECISAAWARFSHLLELSSDLSVPEDVSLYTFYMRLDMESAREHDLLAGGSFEHQSLMERREILEFFLEAYSPHTNHNEPHQESESIHESLLIDDFELRLYASHDSSREPSSGPRTLKEEDIQPLEFSHIFCRHYKCLESL